MKKTFKMYWLYIMQLTIIGIFVLVLVAYNLQVSEKSFFENRMYSENVMGIQISDYRNSAKVKLDITDLPDADFMIYKFLSEELGESIRGVYGTKDVFGLTEYIQKGRFFKDDDYANKTTTAVIGNSILPMTIMENGKRYYLYNQEKFEVIGIFKETGTELDEITYLNLTSLLLEPDNKGLYYIDAKDKEIIQNVLDHLKMNAQGKYETMDVAYESTITYELGKGNNTLMIFSVLASIFCLFITTIFFVIHQRYTVAIKKLCGMTKKNIIFEYGRNMAATVLLSLSLIIIAMLGLQNLNGTIFSVDTLKSYHYIITEFVLLVVAIFNTFYITHLSNGVNISDTLKGM